MSKKEKQTRAGDLVFLLSILITVSLAVSGAQHVSDIFVGASSIRLTSFLLGLVLGGILCHLLVRNHLSVLFHELKHAVVALLAGNTPKGIQIGRASGHFQYSYTEDTKSYNAFIFLAPYTLPLFTILCLGGGIYPLWEKPLILLALVGFGYGADLVSGIRDIHPRQTDFSSLHGGFGIGILYVTALHFLIFFSLLAWAANGYEGLELFCRQIFSSLFGGSQVAI